MIAAVSQSMSVTWVQECFAQKGDGGWWMVICLELIGINPVYHVVA